ncbi:MAG: helix-turn-helix transcriptional regulator [Bacteroidetes bacterium]|nr:helix-turn-helix transcriptional regulator [Bacteroidota bacterium]
MNEPFLIYKLNVDDAIKILASPEEPHIHDYEELIVGMEGRLEHFIDFKSAILNSPYVSFVTKSKIHRVKPIIAEGKFTIWVMRFRTDFIPETAYRLYSYYHDQANIMINEDSCFARMDTLCEMMYGEMQQSKPKLAVVHDLLITLFTMIEGEREKNADRNQDIPKTQNTTFKNFLIILEENFHRPEGVDFYAKKLFMSVRNLNFICQNVLQKSVSEIIETRKLIEAKNLLITTDKPISEIGFELGYNEKAYFTSVFKKKTGQTPSEFREQISKFLS